IPEEDEMTIGVRPAEIGGDAASGDVRHRTRRAGIGDGRDKQIDDVIDRRGPGEVLAVRTDAHVVAVGIVEEDLARNQFGLARLSAYYARKRQRQAYRGSALQENTAIDGR